MSMAVTSGAALGIAGIAVLLIGFAGALGAIPQLSASGTPGVSVVFATSSSNLTATVVDYSNAVGGAFVLSANVFWGDGDRNTSEPMLGFTAHHTYAAAGTYEITEQVIWLGGSSPFPQQSRAASPVTVTSSSTTTCSQNHDCPGTMFVFNAATGGLILAGGGLTLAAVAPVPVYGRAGIAIAAGVLGLVIGLIAGGPGPL
ncbi:MAG: hypothetical protein ACREDE_09815 [Thermoplasmata archaeon]